MSMTIRGIHGDEVWRWQIRIIMSVLRPLDNGIHVNVAGPLNSMPKLQRQFFLTIFNPSSSWNYRRCDSRRGYAASVCFHAVRPRRKGILAGAFFAMD
jgi:hypothetical protein